MESKPYYIAPSDVIEITLEERLVVLEYKLDVILEMLKKIVQERSDGTVV